MVNVGHASGACETCKIRHIKCDETQPYCLRCISAKRVCMGFRVNFPPSWRSNFEGQHQAQKRKAIKLLSAKPFTHLVGDRVNLHFAENFIMRLTEPYSSLGFLHGLDRALVEHCSCGILYATLNVFATGFYMLSESAQTLAERRTLLNRYQMVIHATRQSLSSPRRSWALVVTTYLLALYEVRPFGDIGP